MTTLRLAWRNLQRNKRRTVLTASALTVGIMVLIVSRGLLDGIDQQSIDNLITFDLAHVKAFAPGYIDQEFPDLDSVLSGVDQLIDNIDKVEGVKASTARLEMTGQMIFGIEETFVRVIGIDTRTDPEVFGTLDAIVEGETIDDETPAALIGDRLAKDLGIKVGDLITVLVRSAPGALNPRILTISGILSSGHPKVDQFAVFIPLSLARDMALLPNSATEIAVKADRESRVKRLEEQLAAAFPDLDWRDWKELATDFLSLARMKRIGSGIVIGVLILMAAVGIANTLVISVYERTREIGALRALGFTRKQVKAIFLWEGFLIGLIAGIVAVVLGVAIVAYLSKHGISLATYGEMDIGYPVRDAIYPIVSSLSVASSFVFGLVLSLVASWGSANRAARGEVVRALREGAL